MKRWRHVFSLCPDVHAPLGHYGQLWRRHFYEGIQGAVERLWLPEKVDFSWVQRASDAEPGLVANERTRASEMLWQQIKMAHDRCGLDAVISYCFGHDLEVSLVEQVKSLGIPWVNFFCDSTHRFSEVEPLARVVSLNWFPEGMAAGLYQALGVPYLCSTYAMNPVYMADLRCREPRYEVGFVGVPSTNRITQIGLLRLMGCRVEIRGRGWIEAEANPFHNPVPMHRRFGAILSRGQWGEKILRRLLWPMVKKQAGPELAEGEYEKFISSCQILMGFNQAPGRKGRLKSYMKFRDVEFPGLGCCYLTESNEDVEKVFEVGREILVYRSLSEAAEMIRRIRKDPEEARKIAEAGRNKVLARHCWSHRLKEMAEAVG